MANSPVTYHIIGGGIAGLACAWFIKHRNKKIRTVVYEAAPHLGGRTYSYFDEGLAMNLDNALHAFLGANKFMAQFARKDEWHNAEYFINMAEDNLNTSAFKNRNLLLKSFCNTAAEEIAPAIKKKVLWNLFPFIRSKRKVCFSRQNLSPRIINVLAGYADEVHLNCRLQKIKAQFGMAAQLDFGKTQVDIGAKDKVIVALDNISCRKLLDVAALAHNGIANIIYRTSQTIFLPKGASCVGLTNGLCDWVFSSDNLLTAVISDYKSAGGGNLAVRVWEEIDKIRGVNSAFMPPYKAFCHKNATIRQNAENNMLRPENALTEYPNVFIAGDWTMRNYPCCMETAVKSAERAVKTALKSA